MIQDSTLFQKPTFLSAIALQVIAVVGLTRVYDRAPPQAIGLTVVSGTLLILLLHRFLVPFREFFDRISTEQLICWHAIRAPIGAAFLVMASHGLLPTLFATRAGYGDIVAAFLGVSVVVFGVAFQSTAAKRTLYIGWNIIGLIDLMVAVGTGVYLGSQNSEAMVWIARLPLLLVPTFILPILFATHLLMLSRLIRWKDTSATQPN